MEKFIITGLPKCGGPWLANLFTYKDSFCFNSALRQCKSIAEWQRLFGSIPERHVGDSDSGVLLICKEIKDFLDTVKLVVVEVDALQCEEYFVEKYSLGNEQVKTFLRGTMTKLINNLQYIKATHDPFIIRIEELQNKDRCKELWEYILPDSLFTECRWDLLKEMNITAITDHLPMEILQTGNALFLLRYM